MMKFSRVVVGMSGGVDSAVSALILKNKGYDVHGVFMKNWDIADEKGICHADNEFKDALLICDKLRIPLTQVNFVKEYWNDVFEYMIREYQNGCTPNPDILCNKHIKFDYFYKYAIDVLGADAIATGHYARTSFGTFLEHYQPNKKAKLLQSADEHKDQTFFLCQINQEPLRKTMFPLGDLLKSDVKKIALQNKMEEIVHKKESMGICFIGKRNFQEFISEYIQDKSGDFVNIDTGKIVGKHSGIHKWTMGQRSRVGGAEDPYFIGKRDFKSNSIYVGMGSKHPIIHTSLIFTDNPHWISDVPKALEDGELFKCKFKFQHTHDLVDCQLFRTSKGLIVSLFASKRAVSEGQFAVFYKNDECLGSARVCHRGITSFTLNWLENNDKRHVLYEDQVLHNVV